MRKKELDMSSTQYLIHKLKHNNKFSGDNTETLRKTQSTQNQKLKFIMHSLVKGTSFFC